MKFHKQIAHALLSSRQTGEEVMPEKNGKMAENTFGKLLEVM